MVNLPGGLANRWPAHPGREHLAAERCGRRIPGNDAINGTAFDVGGEEVNVVIV